MLSSVCPQGEVKKRRAKREKLEGDFTGSCMEKIEFDETEKPSLKRPEPRPEEPKPEKREKRRSRGIVWRYFILFFAMLNIN